MARSPGGSWTRSASLPLAAGLAGLIVGELAATAAVPLWHDRFLPWVIGRGLGIASYLALTGLVLLGLWFRHPWRPRTPLLHPATQLRLHAALAAAALALAAGHVLTLVLDPYAGVGWLGALIPGQAHYRPLAVALGTVGLDVGLLVGGTAALAGRLGRAGWRRLHALAAVAFVLVWVHGVFAGSDTSALRGLYAVTAAMVVGLAVSRRLAGAAGASIEPVR